MVWQIARAFSVRGPGIVGGTRAPNVGGNVDLAPTFLDLAGVPIPAEVDGRSIAPLLRGDVVAADLGKDTVAGWRTSFLVVFVWKCTRFLSTENVARFFLMVFASCGSALIHHQLIAGDIIMLTSGHFKTTRGCYNTISIENLLMHYFHSDSIENLLMHYFHSDCLAGQEHYALAVRVEWRLHINTKSVGIAPVFWSFPQKEKRRAAAFWGWMDTGLAGGVHRGRDPRERLPGMCSVKHMFGISTRSCGIAYLGYIQFQSGTVYYLAVQ
jgi:hypothetical protein